jgi:hypothetical protein
MDIDQVTICSCGHDSRVVFINEKKYCINCGKILYYNINGNDKKRSN